MVKTAVEASEIRSGIPFPKHRAKSFASKLYKMKIGDSIIAGEYSEKLTATVSALISKYKKNYPKKVFSQRKLEDGTIGVWRLK